MINRYNCPEVAAIWDDQHRYWLWMKIELTFLEVFKTQSFTMPSQFSPLWINRIKSIEAKRKHDVASFVEWLEEYVASNYSSDIARFVHYGLTSSDILDTAFTMQIMESNHLFNKLITNIIKILKEMSSKYSNLLIMGRTHGQAAEPIPFSSKLNAYAAVLGNFYDKNTYCGKMSGSVGDNKYFPKETSKQVLQLLGLEVSPLVDGQIIHRAYYAEFMNQWAVLASVIGKIATDIRLLAQSGIEEVQEGFDKEQIGSSSLPHKKNPIYSENLCGLARIVRGYQCSVMQDIELWLERDISHSSVERVVFSDGAIIVGFMLNRLTDLLINLRVNEGKMTATVEELKDKCTAQQKMLCAIQNGFSRTEAHEKIRNMK